MAAEFNPITIGLDLSSIKSDETPLENSENGSAGTSGVLSRDDHSHPRGPMVVKAYATDPTEPILHEVYWNEAEGRLKICTATE
jgi:hypothetical protein